MTDWRAMLLRMADELDHYRQLLTDDRREVHPLAVEGRAALAEPVAEGPTPLLPCPFCGSTNLRYDFCASQGCMVCDDCDAVGPSDPRAADPICDDDAAVAAWNRRAALAQAEPEVVGPTDEHLLELYPATMVDEQDAFAFARAVLARWGDQPAPPADGEVAELVAWLRDRAAGNERFGAPTASAQLTRAADLLEQRHPAPVPVSERLPGPEDCDAEGRCWWGLEESDDYEACWTLRKMNGIPFDNTRWLPAHALPLPSGEVQA